MPSRSLIEIPPMQVPEVSHLLSVTSSIEDIPERCLR